MRPSNPFLFFLSCLQHHPRIVMAAITQMSALFTIDPSCANVNLDLVLQDGNALLDAGVTATSELLSSRVFLLPTTRNYMRNMKSSFGTTYYRKRTTSGLNPGDNELVQEVHDNIVTVQQYIASTTNVNPTTHYLLCSDAGFQRTTRAHDVDPTQPQDSTTLQIYNSPFVWYLPTPRDVAGRATVIARPRSSVDTRDTICDGKTAAETFRVPTNPNLAHSFNLIVLCQTLFDPAKALQQISGLSKTSPVGRDGTVSDHIGNYRSVAGLFVHECFHLLGTKFAEREFVKAGATTEALACYNPALTYDLANNPGDFFGPGAVGQAPTTVEFPDPHRIFMEASYLSGVNWKYLDS